MSSGERTYIVVQCCQCNTFQVQNITKTDRYRCSVCGYNQPRDRVFARSSKARDCRQVVANYNHQRHAPEPENIEPRPEITLGIKSNTNWSEYIEDEEQANLLQRHSSLTLGDQQTRRKRKAIEKEYRRTTTNGTMSKTSSSLHDKDCVAPLSQQVGTQHDVPLQKPEASWPADQQQTLLYASHIRRVQDRNTLYQTGNDWNDYLDD
jgi:hypothetical protein